MNRCVVVTQQNSFDAVGEPLTELACVELANRHFTGVVFSSYIYKERIAPAARQKITGFSPVMECEQNIFDDSVAEFLQFISGANLVFIDSQNCIQKINSELTRLYKAPIEAPSYEYTEELIKTVYPKNTPHILHVAQRLGLDTHSETIIDCGRMHAEIYLALTLITLLPPRNATWDM